jgi:hypothetical protein
MAMPTTRLRIGLVAFTAVLRATFTEVVVARGGAPSGAEAGCIG